MGLSGVIDDFERYRRSPLERRWEKDGLDMKARPREIIFSVVIVSVLLAIGVLFHGKISRSIADSNLRYEQALRITEPDRFDWAFRTSAGDAFAVGDLVAENGVTCESLDGAYLSIERDYQEHHMHTQVYTTTDSKGHKHVHTRTYWSWDSQRVDRYNAEYIVFCGKRLPSSLIKWPRYRDSGKTVRIGDGKRYVFRTTPSTIHGTVFTTFENGTMREGSDFYDGCSVDEAFNRCLSGSTLLVVFWISWIAMMAFVTWGFCMIDNGWLEDKSAKRTGRRR